MQKVLITTMGLDIGGAETHVLELALELRRRGYAVLVASSGGVFVETLEAHGVRHYQVPLARRSVRDMLRAYTLLRRIIRGERPDVVHAHARIPGFLCGLLRKTMRFPFVTSAHAHFEVSWLLKRMTNWGQKTLAVSDDLVEYLTENYRVPQKNIYRTVNGINTRRFSPDTDPDPIRAEFALDSGGPVIGHVSRLDREAAKAARVLLEAFPRIADAVPGATLLIAGDGDVYDEIHALAEGVNAALGRRAVVMTGARGDIEHILAACHLFVGVSRAALEAAAACRPVILSGAEGYIGLLTPENAGLAESTNFTCRGEPLPEPGTLARDVIGALTALTEAERARITEFGRSLVTERYSIRRMTDDAIRVYDLVRRHRLNIAMSGYYGFGNCGDEAILQAIHGNIDGLDADVGVTVLSGDPDDTEARYGYSAVNRFNLLAVWRVLRGCDILVSGGGSLLQDYTSTRSLLYYLFIIRLSKALGKKVMVYANGIGPVRRGRNRRLVRRILSRADVISLRDAASAEELRAMGVARDDVHVTADPVFTLTPAPEKEALQILSENDIDTEKPFAVVSIRKWPDASGFCESLAALCDRIHGELGRQVVFLAMQAPGDAEISRTVQALMTAPSHLIRTGYSAQQLMGVIALSDFVLAMRLHTLIFSAQAATPLCGIVYDPKVTAYLEALQMPAAGVVSDFRADAAFDVVRALLQNARGHREALRETARGLEALAREDAARLQALIKQAAEGK